MKPGAHLQLTGLGSVTLRAVRVAACLGLWGITGIAAAHAHAPEIPVSGAGAKAGLVASVYETPASVMSSSPVSAHERAVGLSITASALLPELENGLLAPSPRVQAGQVVRLAQWGGGHQGPNPIEKFFSTLFGGKKQEAPGGDRARIVITPGNQGGDGSGQRSQQAKKSGGGGSGAFCVRTCDGRFFPLGARVDRGSYGAGVSKCQSMCPAAEMDLYMGSSDIASTYNNRGRAYTALPTAFMFRRQLVEGCSCHANGGEGGLRHVDIKDDPTLKAGDVVMTEKGPRVFTGGRRGPPFQDSDFVSPSSFPKLSKEMRQRLKELTLAAR
ncbi:DUF2865 domain-containing protein [Xanthobacter sp. TB0136]|uniref:DUF2865 domain-containing protein n=1 Tax=Xanthobacter sp. TB0136 TaxID=3459177 RepID=UPI004039AA2E